MKEILVDTIKGWQVCRAERTSGQMVTYGEHVENCSESKQYDKKYALWSWEYNDHTPRCWLCEEPVPPEIVGLIKLYYWDEL